MPERTATAIAHPNIAFIKYWGNRDNFLRLPSSGSISMNLEGLATQTCVTFDPDQEHDSLIFNGTPSFGKALQRTSEFLDIVRELAGKRLFANVTTENNFPTAAGIASSAAAFAALALAATRAIGLNLDEPALSRLARRGSGSACRSIPSGFVEWQKGQADSDSYAYSIAAPNHWLLVDLIAIVQSEHKPVGSSEGHSLAWSSPLQNARVASAPGRLQTCRHAILSCDFEALASVIELDSNLMHAVMMTSTPPIFYWQGVSLTLMKLVPRWRKEGLPVCYTLDAGPNVHLICQAGAEDKVKLLLSGVAGLSQVIQATPGGPTRLEVDCTLDSRE
ncbi:MAG TPA: diphosphomevalonate decarboxylase [Anaerolineaceae bacterium]|nr:diphosphomevalonate decarboxylase [Anaerolineaceae bacterium]